MAEATAITVGVRLRPFVGHEAGQQQVLRISGKTVSVVAEVASAQSAQKGHGDPVQAKQFTFDHAMDSSNSASATHVSQAKCYQLMARCMVEHVFQGYSTCLFCYGQTGTGKTMTIMGILEEPEEQGLLVRLLRDVFEEVRQHEAKGSTVELRVQIMEVYNEKIRDLLRDEDVRETKLDVHVHPKLGVYVKGVNEEVVENFEQCVQLIDRGNNMKSVAATQMNAKSSRAHTVFKLKMDRRSGDERVASEVFFVDLAGRENEKTTKVSGERMIELTFINKSLMWLAQCIQSLGGQQKSKNPEAPVRKDMSKFRNSKLTLLLSNALSGNSKTAMIGTLSPAGAHFEESISTLNFASTVKNIKLEARAKTGLGNQSNEHVISALQEEIRILKDQLAMPQESRGESQHIDGDELQRQMECAQGMITDFQKKWEEECAEHARLQKELEEEHAGALELQRICEHERAEASKLRKMCEDERAGALELKKKWEDQYTDALHLQKKWEDERAETLKYQEQLREEHEQAQQLQKKQTHTNERLVASRFSLAVVHAKLERARASIQHHESEKKSKPDRELAMPLVHEVPPEVARRLPKAEKQSKPGRELAMPPVSEVPPEVARPPIGDAADDVANQANISDGADIASEGTGDIEEVRELRRQLNCSRELCQQYREKLEHEQAENAALNTKRQQLMVDLVVTRMRLALAGAKLARAGPQNINFGQVTPLAEALVAEAGPLRPSAFNALGDLPLLPIAETQKAALEPRRTTDMGDEKRKSVAASALPVKGYLWKKSPNKMRFMAPWDRRFVTLICGRLSWGKEEQTDESKGFVDLPCNQCTVEAILGSTTQFGLHVQGGSGNFTGGEVGVRTFLFDCEGSAHTRFEWMAAIKEHLQCNVGNGPNDWAAEVIRSGAMKFMSGRWLFLKPESMAAASDRDTELPPSAFLDPAQVAKMYEDCGCLVVLN